MIGEITWNYNHAQPAWTNEDESTSRYSYVKGYITHTTVIVHEGGHGLSALRALLKKDPSVLEAWKNSFNSEHQDEYSLQYDNQEEEQNTTKIENVYIRQINAYEKRLHPSNPIYQPIRLNHKGGMSRQIVGLNEVEDANMYREWRILQNRQGKVLNDGGD